MPRTARASQGGYCYHVLNRGNARRTVFHKDGDFAAFVKLLRQAGERVPVRLLAYCLMPNHFHLVLWPREDGELSDYMMWLLTAHVRRYAHRAVDIDVLFAQAAVIQEEVDLRCEIAGPHHFEDALQFLGLPGRDFKRNRSLQTEAAIAASAIGDTDDAHRMARRIVQPKGDDVLADSQPEELTLRFLECRAGAVAVLIVAVAGHAEEHDGDQKEHVG
jgi:REP element-mobilizing transposase RayT